MLSPELTAGLGGSDVLLDRRRRAAEAAVGAGLPSFEEEVWRYSPIDDLDLARFSFGAPSGAVGQPGLVAEAIDEASAVVTVLNGTIADLDVRHDKVRIVAADAGDGTAIGSVMTTPVDVFSQMNMAFTSAPVLVEIAPGAIVEAPIVIRHYTDAEGLVWFPRSVVVLGEDSEATVIEHHASADIEALTVPVTEIDVRQAARCRYLTVQELASRVWQLGTQMSDIARDARLATTQIALGGAYPRMRIDTRMNGAGANGDINAVYFGRGTSSIDFRTFQTHVAPNTDSSLMFKGAVDDASRAIYTGLIRIEPHAAGVNAHQTNRNLKLSADAWAESVPNLEIENNDVRCSHASAVGPVDEEQLFYLESRGVPSDVAETLVVRGFFAEVLEQVPVQSVARATERRLAELLAQPASQGGTA